VIGFNIFGTMLPLKDNRVKLGSNRDPYGLPQVEILLRYSEADKATTGAARDEFLNVLSESGLAPRVLWSTQDPVPGSSIHFGGSIRMHESPEHGLTDGWGRMHSVRNVTVADASVFTTCVEKNPTLTVMALANRSAGRLAIDLKAGNLAKTDV
jgi:choline dehydrogenase-like flavoprotein